MYKKISLLLSFVLVTLVFAWNYESKANDLSIEYPSFVFDRSSYVDYRGTFDLMYSRIRDGRILETGDKVYINKSTSAEIYLNAESVLRLGDDTEIELIQNQKNNFTINLTKWRIWANVNNLDLKIKTGRSLASLNNATVEISRDDGKTVFTGIKYNTKIAFLDKEDNYLNYLFLPNFNKITVVDSAITDAYFQLKLTKLKKEIRMTHLNAEEIKENEWFANNLSKDIIFIGWENNQISQKYADVRLRQMISKLRNSLTSLTFIEEKNQAHYFQRLNDLYQNAFYFASLGENERAESNLDLINQLVWKLDEKYVSLYFDYLVSLYGTNQAISFNDWEYFLKTRLEKDILTLAWEKKDLYQERFLMDEIANFEKYLYEYKLAEAKIILTWIVDFWDKKENISDFEKKILLTHGDTLYYNILSNIENIDEDLLNLHLKLEEVELANLAEDEKNEESLRMLNSRIALGNSLLKIKKYRLAKFVTEENIAELALNLDQTSNSVQNYLALLKKDVETKIAYIEDNLHGSAHVKEENYKTYFLKTEAEKEAYAYLTEYENNKEKTEEKNTSDVVYDNKLIAEKFKAEGIYVLSVNIEQLSGLADKFLIKEAYTNSGNMFSAKYNVATNSFYEIEFEWKKIEQSFMLNEIELALNYVLPVIDTEEIEIVEEEKPENNLAFELRREATLQILKDLNLSVEKNKIVQDSKGNLMVTLQIDETEVVFILDEIEKTAENIALTGVWEIVEKIDLENLTETVQKFVAEKEQQEKIETFISLLKENHFMFNAKQIEEEWNSFKIKSIYDPASKVLFSGIYDFEKKVFLEITADDFEKLENLKVSEISKKLKELKIAKELEEEAKKQALLVSTGSLVSTGASLSSGQTLLWEND